MRTQRETLVQVNVLRKWAPKPVSITSASAALYLGTGVPLSLWEKGGSSPLPSHSLTACQHVSLLATRSLSIPTLLAVLIS